MTRVSVIPALPVLPSSTDASEWNFSPDLESEITTLAAWCQVKQQQREPISSTIEDSRDDLDEQIDDEECTNLLTPLSQDGDAEIKKRFLDRLAEILCYRKDPSLITSTALIYNEKEVTIVAARNSTSGGKTWLEKDTHMLEYLVQVLETVSAENSFGSQMLLDLQSTLVEYYSQRIRYHAKNAMSIEKGDTGLRFFKDSGCKGVVSGQLAVCHFVKGVETIYHSVDFFTKLKATLTPNKFCRVLEELACIRRPMQGAEAFLDVAQQCPGFRKIKVVLLNSLAAKKVKIWQMPNGQFSATPQLESKYRTEVKKKKNFHAEIILMAHLLERGLFCSEIFPYLGVSKKTCLLCGHFLREMGYFHTRGNHGKCYSQWTFPHLLRTTAEVAERLQTAVQGLRDILRAEGTKHDVPHRDAEKESTMVAPISPRYGREISPFNSVIEDPRFLMREAEWLARSRPRGREANMTPGNDEGFATSSHAHEGASEPQLKTRCPIGKGHEAASSVVCTFCKATRELTYVCEKCEVAAYCTLDCYRSDWHRHKFSCNLGRSTDATDYLVLACHDNELPLQEDVVNQYGFNCFVSGHDQWRLFKLYRRLVVDWGIDEDELRSAVKRNTLKEMLMFRCSQTRDPVMLIDMRWLENEERFGANGEGQDIASTLEAVQRELLSPGERKVPIAELRPREKIQALVFYTQIRNRFKPKVDEDNWISLGFCTAADLDSEQRLACVYEALVERCRFEEFWNAMVKSSMVELFSKYELGEQISHMRNFKRFMAIVQKWHESVWELKRFTRMNVADPARSVIVDYGFGNCKDPRQRMQLREMYQKYFEQGEDEMRLHEACVAGKLGSFLKTVLGSGVVSPDLVWNPYPLEKFPLMGMVVKSIIICPESSLDQVNAWVLEKGDEKKAKILTIPDAETGNAMRRIQERSAFLRTGLRKRYYTTSDGTVVEEFGVMG
ncbi:phosphoserine aminotransferase [Trichoderma arundinaceum]|uniref:Phosphoserine aminotransferase n=1 Tax=Trichoderma arundinaceum TaxID=490622 RepID=A0A395NIQ6_TRIAR|nr:phosphoserine aminotransferase [Trichoderma arundinaceum]